MATSLHPTNSPLISGWTSQPIPNLSLSASGLIVLADLSTIANRTALRGGSSWLDALLLAPGLHYQQAADKLTRGENAQVLTAVEIDGEGKATAHRIVNQPVVNYVLRMAKEGRTVVLDVGALPVQKRSSWGLQRKERVARGQRAVLYGGSEEIQERLSWAAQLLYVASPVLTCVAVCVVVLLTDWWALAIIGLLMVSRILNITVIKSRSTPKPARLPPPFAFPLSLSAPPRLTQYTITLNPTTYVVLRGLSSDLYAITTTVWLRPKSHFEGYLEAIAKVLVYLVAVISGNATQAGNIVLLVLLLVSAGLLALSNARQQGLRNGGRVMEPTSEGKDNGGYGRTWPLPAHRSSGNGNAGHDRAANERSITKSWPETSDLSSMATTDGALERGRAASVTRRILPSDDSVEYEIRLETRAAAVEASPLRGQ